jgi:hypothetical protein
MKSNNNIYGYINTASLLRERIVSDDYILKSIKECKKSIHQRQLTIGNSINRHSKNNNSPVEILPSIKSSNNSLSIIFSLRDSNNKKLFSGFNYNEKFDEVLKRRKYLNKSIDKSIDYENKLLKERIKRIHSPLSNEKIFKDYDMVKKPVLKRIQKIYPIQLMSLKVEKMQKKVKILNLK